MNYTDAPWDAKLSTQKHEIIFKNGKSIEGYSKRESFREMLDKVKMTRNLICRLYKSGYLNPKDKRGIGVDRIKFYKRSEDGEWNWYFTLYLTHHEWNESLFDKRIDTFLMKFYNLIRNGKNPFLELYISSKGELDNPTDLGRARFSNLISLKHHCLYIFTERRVPQGEVLKFFIDYCNKFFNGYSESDLEFIKNL